MYTLCRARKDIDQLAPCSIKALFERLHADVANIRFFSKAAVEPKYCFLAVDLSTSKVYTYPIKFRNLLKKKLAEAYNDISKKRNKSQVMRLQVDRKFQQNEIKKLSSKFNVDMFSSRIRGVKVFAAKQKIREIKKLLSKSKKIHRNSSTKRIDPKKK